MDSDMERYKARFFGRFCEVWDWKYRHDFQGLCRFYRAGSLYMRNLKGVVVEDGGEPVAFVLVNDGGGMISPYVKTPPILLGGKTYVKLEYAEVSRRSVLARKQGTVKAVLDSAVSVLLKSLKCDGLFVFGEGGYEGPVPVKGLKSVKVFSRDLSEAKPKEPKADGTINNENKTEL